MRRFLLPALLACSIACAGVAVAAKRPLPRPFTGIGLLVVRTAGADDDAPSLPLYRQPGLDRIAEVSSQRLCGLDTVLPPQPAERRVTVTAVRGRWCRIIYDDADREAWLEKPRSWQFIPWERFLKGRFVRFLPGLRPGVAVVRQEAGDAAPELAPPAKHARLRVLQIADDWAQVMVDFSRIGWLRWRDRDGRFLVAVEP